MNIAFYAASLAASGIVSYLAIHFYLRYATHKQILDVPNERSSHVLPTPRGAGIAFAGIFFAFIALIGINHFLPLRETVAILSGILVAAIGYWDDRCGLSIRKRLLVQLLAAGLVVASLANFHLPGEASSSIFIIGILVAIEIVGITWLLNLTNFMDGIDGIVAIEVLTVTLVCAAIIVAEQGMTVTSFLYALLGATVAPFLFFNWSPAKIFMGDVGSCFIGFMLSVISLIAVAHHHLSLFCPLILLAVFICDATSTLLTRMITGQRWYEAHRTHAFQILASQFGHRRVSASIGIVNLLWLAPMAIAAEYDQAHGLIYTVIAFAPILVGCRLLGVGNPNSAFILQNSSAGNTALVEDGNLQKTARIIHQVFPSLQLTLMFFLSLMCAYTAFAQHIDSLVSTSLKSIFFEVIVLWSACQSIILICFRLHRRHWRFTSVEEFPALAGITLLSSIFGAVCAAIFLSMRGISIPHSMYLTVFLMESALSILALCGLRVFLGQISSITRLKLSRRQSKPVLICSADSSGISMLSEIRLHYPEYRPIGFIDERPEIHGVSICGLKVLGRQEDLKKLVKKYSVRHIFISQKMQAAFATEAIRQDCIAENVGLHVVSTIAITSLDAA